MHVLNKVLVYKEEGFDFNAPEEERISEARSIAENETEDYWGPVYDWRETANAGRWSDEYPKQVYFAQDDIDWFIAEINEAVSSQKLELNTYLKELKEKMGTDLEKIVSILMGETQPSEEMNTVSGFLSFALLKIAKLVHGDYNCDSYIYSTADSSARIYPEDIEHIKQEPDKWAMVMFDYHF